MSKVALNLLYTPGYREGGRGLEFISLVLQPPKLAGITGLCHKDYLFSFIIVRWVKD